MHQFLSIACNASMWDRLSTTATLVRISSWDHGWMGIQMYLCSSIYASDVLYYINRRNNSLLFHQMGEETTNVNNVLTSDITQQNKCLTEHFTFHFKLSKPIHEQREKRHFRSILVSWCAAGFSSNTKYVLAHQGLGKLFQ